MARKEGHDEENEKRIIAKRKTTKKKKRGDATDDYFEAFVFTENDRRTERKVVSNNARIIQERGVETIADACGLKRD